MKRFISPVIILLLITAVILAQLGFDRENAKLKASAAYQPLVASGEVYKKFNLGLQVALADYFWLQAIQYYGGFRSDQSYVKLADYLDLTTELDPKFSYPYAFAALVLPSEKIDQGYTIAQKGIDRQIPDWQIAYYLASAYHIYKKDKINAAKYFDLAANTPGAPESAKFVSASYNSAPDNRKTAEAIWTTIYENSHDQLMIDRAKEYLSHYQLMDFLDQASEKYKSITGHFPKELADLVSAGILKEIPQDPFNLTFSFSENGNTVLKN